LVEGVQVLERLAKALVILILLVVSLLIVVGKPLDPTMKFSPKWHGHEIGASGSVSPVWVGQESSWVWLTEMNRLDQSPALIFLEDPLAIVHHFQAARYPAFCELIGCGDEIWSENASTVSGRTVICRTQSYAARGSDHGVLYLEVEGLSGGVVFRGSHVPSPDFSQLIEDVLSRELGLPVELRRLCRLNGRRQTEVLPSVVTVADGLSLGAFR
jgi:hypothetical protein